MIRVQDWPMVETWLQHGQHPDLPWVPLSLSKWILGTPSTVIQQAGHENDL